MTGSTIARIVLADDEKLLRSAMTALLPQDGTITVVAQAEDGEQAVRETLSNTVPTFS